MRVLAFVAFLCATGIAPAPAHAASTLVGTGCSTSTAGQVKMDTDGVNLIACLCNTTANCDTVKPADLVWKSMSNTVTSAKQITCPSGKILTGVSNGAPICAVAPSTGIYCPSGVRAIVNGVPQC
ncbi:MAG: hypothetical protein WC464_08665 [Bdellovibrionales bacterium]